MVLGPWKNLGIRFVKDIDRGRIAQGGFVVQVYIIYLKASIVNIKQRLHNSNYHMLSVFQSI